MSEQQRDAEYIARSMIKKYGMREARILASGYASGVWYEQTESTKLYWRSVIAAIDSIK